MKFSYNWLSELVKNIPKPDTLSELITLHSFQVESIKREKGDYIFDIDVLPDRLPDCSGHIGIAREVSVLTKKAIHIPKIPNIKVTKGVTKSLKVSVEHGTAERYIVGTLENVTVKSSPSHIQEKLKACDMRPINNIVDVSNYIMLETGNPTHAFDYDKIVGDTIYIRHAKSGESIETLDNETYVLSNKHIVIADSKGPLGIAGIKGGKRAQITDKTKHIILETAVFDPIKTRMTSRALSLVTDASLRFSHGLASRGLERVMARFITLARDVSDGKITKPFVDSKKTFAKRAPIPVAVAKVSSVLGAKISEKESIDILKRLGFLVTRKSKGILHVIPPEWRLDVTREENVIEEIGRIYGYDRIDPEAPHARLVHPDHNNDHILTDRLRKSFAELGFSEVQSYAFESRDSESIEARVEVLNPVSEENVFLRTTLAYGVLQKVDRNSVFAKTLNLFEIGNVFRKGKNKPEERLHLSAALLSEASPEDRYFEAKGTVELLAHRFGLADIWFEDVGGEYVPWPLLPRSNMHPHRAVFIKSGTTTIGALYQVHPEAGFKNISIVVELLIPEFIENVEHELEFEPIPRFPAVIRDFSVLVPGEVRVENVVAIIESAGGALLVDSDLFDYYEGDTLGGNRKSLGFHLIFQSRDRTLRDEEVSHLIDAITAEIRKEGWDVRT